MRRYGTAMARSVATPSCRTGSADGDLRAVDSSETRYARSGDVTIAYQVHGEGPVDLVLTPGAVSNVELMWEHPLFRRFLERLASFSRLIVFDKRGTGLSDRVKRIATLEERADDIRAVMDAAGSERAVLMGVSEGGPMAIVFTATHPARVLGLVLYGSYARATWAPDHPWGPTEEEYQRAIAARERPTAPPSMEELRERMLRLAPSLADDADFLRWWAQFNRMSIGPGAAIDLMRMNIEIDVRDVLPAIRVPTLVLHRVGDVNIKVEGARYLAERISGARFVGLPGDDHPAAVGDTEPLLGELESFIANLPEAQFEADTVLATVLFTDLVGSTAVAAELGDRRWRELLERHHEVVRRELARFRGLEVDTAGDGFFATFDGPARAIRCARAVTDAVGELGLEVRAGLHTGECELLGEKVAGIAVSIGARVAARAEPGEVLVSNTVKDLVAGSGIQFADRGVAELKGVPGEWRLWAVEGGTGP